MYTFQYNLCKCRLFENYITNNIGYFANIVIAVLFFGAYFNAFFFPTHFITIIFITRLDKKKTLRI